MVAAARRAAVSPSTPEVARPMDSPTPQRRMEDQVTLPTRVAVLEATTRLQADASKAQAEAIVKSVEALGSKIDSATALISAATSDPAASAMGRALSARIDAMATDQVADAARIEKLEAFVNQLVGSIKTLRAIAIGLGATNTVLAILAILK